ncbi:hypothetical protein BFI45_02040 [Yersinia pestis subsp. microtus bv. Altaica]|nr:hypothetical protein BFI40_03230 [Yersinia pestis subsp. microtus bv. Altaica]OVY77710.1 hypothetical protein BFI50_04570 [Yersinia pestis subsp. microtus bv. Xilingolensis]PST78532.1 hypothetical protein B7R70_15745 [Yersinia pseudotuberculosis]OUY20089.1 hypothetical protein BFI42_02405 [Yersinia pestis subsp. microtus bv. Altaica]OUY91940.1 hypothetical protein BFI44_03225 [Yersinia pestis subsp. microtus bv. Altaica]
MRLGADSIVRYGYRYSIVFSIGVLVILFLLDNEYRISEKKIKTHRVHNIPYHPDQLFSAWGRFSRG